MHPKSPLALCPSTTAYPGGNGVTKNGAGCKGLILGLQAAANSFSQATFHVEGDSRRTIGHI